MAARILFKGLRSLLFVLKKHIINVNKTIQLKPGKGAGIW